MTRHLATHVKGILALLGLALALALSGTARAADASWQLWLGDHYVGPLAPPAVTARSASASPLPPVTPPRRELMIVTSMRLATDSAELQRFSTFRQAEGWEIHLATDADWDVPTSAGPDTPQERLRAFLAERYAGDPGAYLLLIGDPDPDGGDLPMLITHPLASVVQYYPDWLADEMGEVPSDLFYADLTGDWDCDGDGDYAEYPDDHGDGCVDFEPELYVGRLPIYDDDAGDLDQLLRRVLDRDLESDTGYRSSVLLPGALFGIADTSEASGGDYPEHSDGAAVLDAIYDALPQPFQDDTWRLYEDTGLVTSLYPHDGSLSEDEVLERWLDGYGLVVWAGHGSRDGVYRAYWSSDTDGDGLASDDECGYPPFMESTRASDLADAPGAFTWHISCDNGFPEWHANLGTALLYGGAVATATASRPAFGVTAEWGEQFVPRPDLATSSTAGYTYALGLVDGQTAGEALAFTKYGLPGDGWTADVYGVDYTGAAWTTRMQYNLYGDPTRSLGLCAEDADCDDGSPCNGVESCDDGFCSRTGDEIDCSSLDDVCTVGSCEAASGQCVAVPRVDGFACDDGVWCTEGDECSDGVCGGEARDCGSRDGYDVYCDEAEAQCVQTAIDADEDANGCQMTPRAGGTPTGLVAALAMMMFLRRRRPRAPRGGTTDEDRHAKVAGNAGKV